MGLDGPAYTDLFRTRAAGISDVVDSSQPAASLRLDMSVILDSLVSSISSLLRDTPLHHR